MGVGIVLAIAIGIFLLFGGGIGFLLFIKTRPQNESWEAEVYQLGEGIREPPKGKDGKPVSDIRLQDLRPYALDTLEKVEKAQGITVFRLVKLQRVTPAVESDVVEYWGEKRRKVSVLLHHDGCTLLKKGYDKHTGEIIFNPLPHSRVNLIKGEMAIRKDRLKKEKDILEAITPWIITGICMMALVGIAYVLGSSYVTMSDNFKASNEEMISFNADQLERIVRYEELTRGSQPTQPSNSGVIKITDT